MDKTYKERITLRRQLLKDHHDIVVAVKDDDYIRNAVSEFYRFIMGTYLPSRFPTMFKVHHTEYDSGKESLLENLITGELVPTSLAKTKPVISALETLGRHVDEEFLFLLPSDENPESYILEAYVTCYPSGFNTREKLGQQLKDIHGPVPSYKEKLEASMDRYFSKLEVGKYVKRNNWTITTGADLYAASGTHARDGDVIKELDHLEIDKVSTCVAI